VGQFEAERKEAMNTSKTPFALYPSTPEEELRELNDWERSERAKTAEARQDAERKPTPSGGEGKEKK
jgi:hypothetical protein